ncbi:MAG: SsrA-binding protein SmpB [Actinobacteria bacterium]|nr:SsrA-binding protein SmpB [Actinomycetota bacterium]
MPAVKVVATNRKARHEYDITETIEAGLVLKGSEVKSARAGLVNLKDSYVQFRDGEAWLVGCHISPYSYARGGGHDPDRDRKLLLHRREITRIGAKVAERGLTLVALRVYFKDGIAKLELGLGRGRAHYDKRRAIRDKEQRREMDRAARHRGRT